MFSCFTPLVYGKKKKRSKESKKGLESNKGEANVSPRVNPIVPAIQPEEKIVIKEEEAVPMPKSTIGNLSQAEVDVAYEGEDEHDEILSVKRDNSDFDLHARANSVGSNQEFVQFSNELLDDKYEKDQGVTPDLFVQSGHVSDPGMGKTTSFSGLPMLKRSCSNIETKRSDSQSLGVSPKKSLSYTDLKNLAAETNLLHKVQSSPLSTKSNCSADRVMLKKRSSSQVLPSRSRKVWWKLFLWSHRNLHKPEALPKPPTRSSASHHKAAGYSSDTLEPTISPNMRKKKGMEESGNQWFAFAMDSASPADRINAWVNSIDETEFSPTFDDCDEAGEGAGFVPSISEVGESSAKNHSSHGVHRTKEEIVQANTVIQSLNSLSSVAHISGMGLKVIPSIAAFSSLRSVNLSGNFIVQINAGSLPKGLHTLDLSRNKISTIDGLRELTKLRVLNLSYNRIARIGHGLSNCTGIKELYLAGNKISNVEGLHRLLKLMALDLSFNKITTAKGLGQLVANYNSLLALNLIGNPVQANIGDDHLRKAVCSLLPNLTYLNKQPIKPQRAREAATDSIARAALGSDGSSRARRAYRRASPSSAASPLALAAVKGRSLDGSGHKKGSSSRHKSRGKQHSVSSSRR